MDRRMRVAEALLLVIIFINCRVSAFVAGADGFTSPEQYYDCSTNGLARPGTDNTSVNSSYTFSFSYGPVTFQEALENGNTTFFCDATPDTSDDELMLLVWYKDNESIYSYDARVRTEWSNIAFNMSGRLIADTDKNPTSLTISALREDDQALYHCRVEFLLSPTRNTGVNLTVTVLPSEPFFLDELGNTVTNKTRPYYEGDTLVLSCLVIGGRPPPKISWYSGETLVDATYSVSDIPNIWQNELYLPLTRDNAETLSCRASNTRLVPALEASLEIELYLPANQVKIQWVQGTSDGILRSGETVTAQCEAYGSHPPPDIIWRLKNKRLTKHSNQTWDISLQAAVSFIQITPTVADNQATLTCEAVNPIMPSPERNSKAAVINLNVTFGPKVEIIKLDDEKRNEVVELDPLHLKCDVKANPPADKYMWYFNDMEIKPGGMWGDNISSNELFIEEVSKRHAGQYACAARNTIGETRADPISIIVLYPPECKKPSITLDKETLNCNVKGLPVPDTYFWHIQQIEHDTQHLTTGSSSLSLDHVAGPLSEYLNVSCEAENGIASQYKSCTKTISLRHLRPPQPHQCDLAFEYKEFQVRCIPVENATHYELSLWRLSKTNASLFLDRKKSIEVGNSLALTQNGDEPWLVRGGLGLLNAGDEAGTAACNRYGCSAALLLRPTENLLSAAVPPWWKFLTERDAGISIGVVLLVIMFACSTILAIRLARRSQTKAQVPVIQVLQLDDVTRDYLNRTGDIHVHPSCSLRSNSSDCTDEQDNPSLVECHCAHTSHEWVPPPDVTLTLQRESAV